MRITVDTNVLVSGTFWSGDSFRILDLVDKGEIELVLSDEILDEYYDVVDRDEIIDKIMDKKLITSAIADKVISNSVLIEAKEKFYIVKEDPDDNEVINCAFAGKVNYIVSQDRHLLDLREFMRIKIVDPREFLSIFENSQGEK